MTSLAPEMAEALRINADLQPPGERDALPWPEQRRIFEATRRYWNTPPLDVGPVTEGILDCGVACRRYGQQGADAPLVIYLHGGGWVVGSLDSHDCVARALCLHGRLQVVSLDYPLAPETAFADMISSVIAAVREIATTAPTRRIALVGDSAGAHLAVHAAALLRGEMGERLAGLVSLYGVLARSLETASARAFGDGRFGLSAARMALYWQTLGAEADPLALAAPLPPALIIAADCDILRDASKLFVDQRSARGEATEMRIESGMGHAFMGYGKVVSRVAGTAEEVGAYLRGL